MCIINFNVEKKIVVFFEIVMKYMFNYVIFFFYKKIFIFEDEIMCIFL